MISTFIQNLHKVIESSLPGEEAHLSLIPERLPSSAAIKQNLNYKNSAVAVLLFEKSEVLQSVLIERPLYDGVHSGQMSFPGGKVEKSDANLVETSLREMGEEIGFKDAHIFHLGTLTPVYVPVSQFMIHPQVFYTNKKPKFIGDEREVASIVEFSVLDILNPTLLLNKNITIGKGIQLKEVAYFNIKEKVVWGATCLILNELKMCFNQIVK